MGHQVARRRCLRLRMRAEDTAVLLVRLQAASSDSLSRLSPRRVFQRQLRDVWHIIIPGVASGGADWLSRAATRSAT